MCVHDRAIYAPESEEAREDKSTEVFCAFLERWPTLQDAKRARRSMPKSFWARAFYDQQRAKGAAHQVAVRSLAFKWTRILFRVWKDRVPYDETRYLQALEKRRSPLLKNLAQA